MSATQRPNPLPLPTLSPHPLRHVSPLAQPFRKRKTFHFGFRVGLLSRKIKTEIVFGVFPHLFIKLIVAF